MDKNRADWVLDMYKTRYSNILGKIWPTIGSNGFNEHNLTVNYTIAFETVAARNNEETSAWFEFQIPNESKNNHRMDGLIINHTTKELYLVEAKRFSKNKLKRKRRELGYDFIRIENLDLSRFENLFVEKELISDYQIFGILLFDLWTENKEQIDLLNQWQEICDKPDSKLLSGFFDINVDCDNQILIPMMQEVKSDSWEKEDYSYYLGTLIWKKRA